MIGRRKFIYDLWGDTVNIASRMESHGVPGEIQVTERVAAGLVAPFVLRPRGTIDVKGKGLMTTFFLDRVGSSSSAHGSPSPADWPEPAEGPAPLADRLSARVEPGGEDELNQQHPRQAQPHSTEPA